MLTQKTVMALLEKEKQKIQYHQSRVKALEEFLMQFYSVKIPSQRTKSSLKSGKAVTGPTKTLNERILGVLKGGGKTITDLYQSIRKTGHNTTKGSITFCVGQLRKKGIVVGNVGKKGLAKVYRLKKNKA